MASVIVKSALHLLGTLLVAGSALAQTGGSSTSATPSPAAAAAPSAGSGSGTYSIEAEILAYKSLQVNSTAIATDVTGGLPVSKDTSKRASVLVVPSVSVLLPAFQQWRANMAIVGNFQSQYADANFDADSCLAEPQQAHAPSFSEYTTAITEGVTALQSILSLFANSQSVAEFQGTIQDQALITAVSRELKKSGFEILIPDVYTSWTIADVDGSKFPYLGQLADLIAKHGKLQKIYQCNTLVVSAGTQLQQAEVTRAVDYVTLAGLDLTKKDAPQSLLNEIANMKAQIELLRGKIGIKKDADIAAIQSAENAITAQGRVLNNKKSTEDQKEDALQKIQAAEASVAPIENPILLQASLIAAQAQSLVSGIEGYLAGLTGGAVSLSSPSVSSAPVTASAAAPATGGAAATATSPASAGASAPATPAATPAASAPSSTTPPLLTILAVDGLARRMGLPKSGPVTGCTTDDRNKNLHCPEDWRILWLKSMESGGADITEANIFGSHPHFGGGAVSGYALFKLDGSLECSGNVAAYGGYVKAKDFAKHGAVNGGSKPTVMLDMTGGCAPDKPAPETPGAGKPQ
jgi:hypothetical protein